MMNKNKLVFDPADAANSDFVGSYVLSSDGTKITHTNVSGKDGLDVNLVNTSIAVTASDLDIRSLVFADDKVDVSGSEVSLDATTLAALENITVQNGAGAAAVNIQDGGNSITVDGTVSISGDVNVTQGTDPWNVAVTAALPSGNNNIGDVDVASLPGSLQGYADGAAWAAGSFGAEMLAVRKDATGPLTGVADGDFSPLQVDADGNLKVAGSISVDFSYDYAEDAAHASGDIGAYILSVREDTLSSSTSASGDYQSFKTDALGRLYANNTHQTMAHAAVSVTTSATDLAATDLVNRKRILIQNLGTKSIYIGKDNTVTTANGIELFSGSSMELDIGPGVDAHAISASGTQNVRVMQLA